MRWLIKNAHFATDCIRLCLTTKPLSKNYVAGEKVKLCRNESTYSFYLQQAEARALNYHAAFVRFLLNTKNSTSGGGKTKNSTFRKGMHTIANRYPLRTDCCFIFMQMFYQPCVTSALVEE
jgi:hypothetical protein